MGDNDTDLGQIKTFMAKLKALIISQYMGHLSLCLRMSEVRTDTTFAPHTWCILQYYPPLSCSFLCHQYAGKKINDAASLLPPPQHKAKIIGNMVPSCTCDIICDQHLYSRCIYFWVHMAAHPFINRVHMSNISY